MKVGTKSLLFGVHQVFLHPLYVLIAWCKLYGFPEDWRIILCIFVHDWGYWGKPNIDGAEGKIHPELGAKIVHYLLDTTYTETANGVIINKFKDDKWYNFCIYHSRSYSDRMGTAISQLCIADKFAFVVQPKWQYIIFSKLSGEINEYLDVHNNQDISNWHDRVKAWTIQWVNNNKYNYRISL